MSKIVEEEEVFHFSDNFSVINSQRVKAAAGEEEAGYILFGTERRGRRIEIQMFVRCREHQ